MRFVKLTGWNFLRLLRHVYWALAIIALYILMALFANSLPESAMDIAFAAGAISVLFLAVRCMLNIPLSLHAASAIVDKTSDIPAWQQWLSHALVLLVSSTVSAFLLGGVMASFNLWGFQRFTLALFFKSGWNTAMQANSFNLFSMSLIISFCYVLAGSLPLPRRLRPVLCALLSIGLIFILMRVILTMVDIWFGRSALLYTNLFTSAILLLFGLVALVGSTLLYKRYYSHS